MNDHHDFERSLHLDLTSAAERIHPRTPDVGEILSAGAQRVRRRNSRRALGGAVAVGALAIGSVTWLTDGEGGVVTADPTGESAEAVDGASPAAADDPVIDGGAPGASNVSLVPSGLTWRSVNVDSTEAIGLATGSPPVGDGEAPFYAVSTQPGRGGSPRSTLWRSDDGVAWTTGGTTPFPTAFATTMTESASGLYAVGTAPSAASPKGLGGDPMIARSGDAGETWDQIELPIDVAAIEDAPGISNVTLGSYIVDGPAGVVVAVQPYAYPDLSAVLPGVNAADYGYEAHPDGIGLWGGEVETVPCGGQPTEVATTAPESATTAQEPTETTSCSRPVETARYTWAELGITEELTPYLSGRRVLLYRIGADGSVEELGSVDIGEGQTGISGMVSTPTGYVLSGYTYDPDTPRGEGFVLVSPDGVAWTRHALPVGGWGGAPVVWEGGLALLVQTDSGGAVLLQSATGEEWTATDLAPFVSEVAARVSPTAEGWPSQLVGGPSGLSILVDVSEPVDPSMYEESSADTVPSTPSAESSAPTVSAGDATATTVFLATSDLPAVTSVLLHSFDGVAWSADAPPELANRSFGSLTTLRAAGAQVIVAVTSYAGSGTEELPDQLALDRDTDRLSRPAEQARMAPLTAVSGARRDRASPRSSPSPLGSRPTAPRRTARRRGRAGAGSGRASSPCGHRARSPGSDPAPTPPERRVRHGARHHRRGPRPSPPPRSTRRR